MLNEGINGLMSHYLFQSSGKKYRLSFLGFFFAISCYKFIMNKLYPHRRIIENGFTLIELLVTLAIAAVLLSLAAPSFTNLLSVNNAQGAAERLSVSFAYARSEAITRSSNIVICSSENGTTCNTGTAGVNWSDGWLIFIDENADDVLANDGSEETLRIEDISPLLVTATGGASSVCYNSLGEQCNTAAISFTILGSNGSSDSGRSLVVSATGGTTTSKYTP